LNSIEPVIVVGITNQRRFGNGVSMCINIKVN